MEYQHSSVADATIENQQVRVGGKFQLIKKCGSGAFGEIYRAQNVITGELVAVKLEPIKTKYPQLYYESKIYKHLNGGEGIPSLHWYGSEGDYNAMAMDLLQVNLEQLFDYCKRKFTVKTTLMIGDQMIQRLEFMHNKNFIHRDLKPDNFLIGFGDKQNVINLVDFGLAKKYKDVKTGKHISETAKGSFHGTARYASVNSHLGLEQSRRDDLESIGLIMIYFLKGSLPWQGLKKEVRDRYISKDEQIKEMKLSTTIDELTNGLPEEFNKYLQYCRCLQFQQRPDYHYLRKLLKECMSKRCYNYGYKFDWVVKKAGQQIDESDYADAMVKVPEVIEPAKEIVVRRVGKRQTMPLPVTNGEIMNNTTRPVSVLQRPQQSQYVSPQRDVSSPLPQITSAQRQRKYALPKTPNRYQQVNRATSQLAVPMATPQRHQNSNSTSACSHYSNNSSRRHSFRSSNVKQVDAKVAVSQAFDKLPSIHHVRASSILK